SMYQIKEKERIKEEEILKKQYLRKWRTIKWAPAFIIPIGLGIFLLLTLDTEVNAFNLTLSLILFNVISFLLIMIGRIGVSKVEPKIPLKDNDDLKSVTFFDFKDFPIPELNPFTRVDDKQIVIDENLTRTKIILGSITVAFIVFFISIGITPTEMAGQSFGQIFIMFELYPAFTILGLTIITQPRHRVIFDRTTKTITLPAWSIFNKKETIPYEKAVITFRPNSISARFTGDEEIVIENPKRILSGIYLHMCGKEKGYQFAKLIQTYMSDDELPDIPEFTQYRKQEKNETAEDVSNKRT
ncbi:MAG: hypothetical protein LIP00_07040, partial [Parabacteroides sp.]|nr:hypothetical protein [Parabacteroides sp.]